MPPDPFMSFVPFLLFMFTAVRRACHGSGPSNMAREESSAANGRVPPQHRSKLGEIAHGANPVAAELRDE